VQKGFPLFFDFIKFMPGDISASWDVTLQVKRFYDVLNATFGGISDYTISREPNGTSAYFLREVWQVVN